VHGLSGVMTLEMVLGARNATTAGSRHLTPASTRLRCIIHQATSEQCRLFALPRSDRNPGRPRTPIALLAGVGVQGLLERRWIVTVEGRRELAHGSHVCRRRGHQRALLTIHIARVRTDLKRAIDVT